MDMIQQDIDMLLSNNSAAWQEAEELNKTFNLLKGEIYSPADIQAFFKKEHIQMGPQKPHNADYLHQLSERSKMMYCNYEVALCENAMDMVQKATDRINTLIPRNHDSKKLSDERLQDIWGHMTFSHYLLQIAGQTLKNLPKPENSKDGNRAVFLCSKRAETESNFHETQKIALRNEQIRNCQISANSERIFTYIPDVDEENVKSYLQATIDIGYHCLQMMRYEKLMALQSMLVLYSHTELGKLSHAASNLPAKITEKSWEESVSVTQSHFHGMNDKSRHADLYLNQAKKLSPSFS